MNSKQWREIGYKTIFKDGSVFLVRWPKSEVVICTKNNRGDWMRFDKVNEAPWVCVPGGIESLEPGLRDHLKAAAENCYCDSPGGINTCDFCSGVRTL